MTPLQFLAHVCEGLNILPQRLLVAVHGTLDGPPTTLQVHAAIRAAEAISRGQSRLVDVDGQPQVLPVVDDGEPDGGQTRIPGA